MRMLACLVLGIGLAFGFLGTLAAGSAGAGQGAGACQVVSQSYATIQSAVEDANCEIIEVGAGVFAESVTISRSLTLRGQGMGHTTLTGSGNGNVLHIWGEVVVTLSDLAIVNGTQGGVVVQGGAVTIENGLIADNRTGGDGGGIVVRAAVVDNQLIEARLVLNDSVVRNNVAAGDGGGIAGWGADLSMENSTVMDNEARSGGGILSIDYDVAPRCPSIRGTLTVKNSTIHNNRASGGGGGIANRGATLLLQNSTVSGNVAAGDGGAISHYGERAIVQNSTLSGNEAANGAGISTDYDFSVAPYVCYSRTEIWLDNSTLSGNVAAVHGGGIFNGGGGVEISSSTLSRNGAEWGGGGIYSFWPEDEACKFGDCSAHRITIRGSIVANSLRGGECVNEGVAVVGDGGYNIVENGACISAPTSFAGDPLLDELAFNGGATATHALLPGSAAIDASAICAGADQRGFPRPLDGDGDGDAVCDIGSFEFVNFTDLIHMPVVYR